MRTRRPRVVGFISQRPLSFPFLPNVSYPMYVQGNCSRLAVKICFPVPNDKLTANYHAVS
ncbi:hypothetical protein K443DRAFT_682217 [Laccaria amethystina LaAM-08-1]|uniref:Uncharacterized protein n=1 Tax=Laccaria amethystina LaAM-08-1 TaxID=1095629 RepID=A0A0C9WVQ7_9AGAR|nr:hypothetical protein K443DRAFT_682217 [Laccaria amethystina LaAM-08-1]